MTEVPGNVYDWKTGDIEIGKKATGVGTALPGGTVVSETVGTGLWDEATDLDAGRIGVIPNLAQNGPNMNSDSDPTCNVLTGDGAEIYVVNTGGLIAGCRVAHAAGGTVKQTTAGGFAVYVGKEGEGSGHKNPCTNAVTLAVVRIRMGLQ